ncbi:MAG: N-acetylmuramoyl-L-alanine amidase [Pseudomonadota bacterium]
MCSGRRLVSFFSLLSLLIPAAAQAEIKVASARVWPAQDYTRLTMELSAPVQHKLFSLKDPQRLVLDLEGVALDKTLKTLADKVTAGDPYIKSLRVARFKPGMVRIVFDLKDEVKPEVFMLKPVGKYRHRLVLDMYPAHDPLMALVLKGDVMEEAFPAEAPGQVPPDKPARPEVMRLITVAIDAGHGGEDPGAHGRGGTYEKHVTLAIARRLKARIDREPGMRAVLIRDSDYFIPLQMRVVKARKLSADLFVSIHADSFVKSNVRGSSVFALSENGATSAAARWLAKRENEADLIGGVNLDVPDPYLKKTLLDLSQTATINDSLKLGREVLDELGDINTLHKGEVEQAGFAVLKAPDIPSILVETAFISNPEEEKKLKDEAYQEKMAEAIYAGIKRYFASNPPLSRTRLVQN